MLWWNSWLVLLILWQIWEHFEPLLHFLLLSNSTCFAYISKLSIVIWCCSLDCSFTVPNVEIFKHFDHAYQFLIDFEEMSGYSNYFSVFGCQNYLPKNLTFSNRFLPTFRLYYSITTQYSCPLEASLLKKLLSLLGLGWREELLCLLQFWKREILEQPTFCLQFLSLSIEHYHLHQTKSNWEFLRFIDFNSLHFPIIRHFWGLNLLYENLW